MCLNEVFTLSTSLPLADDSAVFLVACEDDSSSSSITLGYLSSMSRNFFIDTPSTCVEASSISFAKLVSMATFVIVFSIVGSRPNDDSPSLAVTRGCDSSLASGEVDDEEEETTV